MVFFPASICDCFVQDDVTFYLFTENLNDTELYEDNLYIVDVENPTVVIIHGWETTSNNTWIVGLTRTYLLTGDYNIITVNWSPIAYLLYPLSVAEVQNIGKIVKIFCYSNNVYININKHLKLETAHYLSIALNQNGFFQAYHTEKRFY